MKGSRFKAMGGCNSFVSCLQEPLLDIPGLTIRDASDSSVCMNVVVVEPSFCDGLPVCVCVCVVYVCWTFTAVQHLNEQPGSENH